MENAIFNAEKMYTFAKGFAMGRGMTDTVNALSYARQKHKGQTRKSGEPYITHPLTMACDAISMGITDDVIVAAIMLHDVVEDCGVVLDDLPVSNSTKEVVNLVTKKFKHGDTLAEQHYYQHISENVNASIVKIIDRCHNISTMAGTFTSEKLDHYISETETYILPLLRTVKDNHPTYSNILFTMKYHIISVLNAIEGTRGMYETHNTDDTETNEMEDAKKYILEHLNEYVYLVTWCTPRLYNFPKVRILGLVMKSEPENVCVQYENMSTNSLEYLEIQKFMADAFFSEKEAKAEADKRANGGH